MPWSSSLSTSTFETNGLLEGGELIEGRCGPGSLGQSAVCQVGGFRVARFKSQKCHLPVLPVCEASGGTSHPPQA
jgi:hypothetical protein